MRKLQLFTSAATLCLAISTTALAQAQSTQSSQPYRVAQLESSAINSTRVAAGFEVFAPKAVTRSTRIDYSVWDEALKNVVLDLGPSLRRRAGKPQAQVGTRQVKGHKSAYRLEGSRITFAYINDEYRNGLTEYRKELQNIPSRIDITRLPRNEQLAFWLNLHNVAVIEQVTNVYPIDRPSRAEIEVDGIKTSIDTAKFLTVKGQKMSPEDIRLNIVYPNWNDSRVMYGFFRGNIGSPKMPRSAFASDNMEYLLMDNTEEFVNSLRGFHESGSYRLVSEIYKEAAPYYFPNFDADLTAHLMKYAVRDTVEEVQSGKPFKTDKYDDMVADLSGGQRMASSGSAIYRNEGEMGNLSYEALRMLSEAENKRRILIQKGITKPRGGYVIIEDLDVSELSPETSTETSETE